jgi:hypothetical protein
MGIACKVRPKIQNCSLISNSYGDKRTPCIVLRIALAIVQLVLNT